MIPKEKASLRRYLRNVSKELNCFPATKKRLLEGFRQEIMERSAERDPSREFGTPEEAASVLQESVDEREAIRAKRRRKVTVAWIVILSLVLLAALLFLFIEVMIEQPVKIVETITDIEYPIV